MGLGRGELECSPLCYHAGGEFNIVIDCNNAGVLAEFYSKLLGWEWTRPRANGWAAVASPTGMVFAFPEVEEYSL